MFSAASVCQFVCCQHDNFPTIKHRINSAVRCTVQKSRMTSNLGVKGQGRNKRQFLRSPQIVPGTQRLSMFGLKGGIYCAKPTEQNGL